MFHNLSVENINQIHSIWTSNTKSVHFLYSVLLINHSSLQIKQYWNIMFWHFILLYLIVTLKCNPSLSDIWFTLKLESNVLLDGLMFLWLHSNHKPFTFSMAQNAIWKFTLISAHNLILALRCESYSPCSALLLIKITLFYACIVIYSLD